MIVMIRDDNLNLPTTSVKTNTFSDAWFRFRNHWDFCWNRSQENQMALESEPELLESEYLVLEWELESGIANRITVFGLESESEWNQWTFFVGIEIRLLNFPRIGTGYGIKMYAESCITVNTFYVQGLLGLQRWSLTRLMKPQWNQNDIAVCLLT